MQNAIDNSGKTASSVACQRGHADVVKIFMQKASDLNIDLNTEDNDGITGFHHAWSGPWTAKTTVPIIFCGNVSLHTLTNKKKNLAKQLKIQKYTKFTRRPHWCHF